MKWVTVVFAVAIALLTGVDTSYAGGDAAAGEAAAASCAGCHGAKGEGAGRNPSLAGLDEATHVRMLREYKARTRGNATMQMFAAPLSEEDMANIAAYYAKLGR